ncbi:MAG: hypothetical protein BWY83_01793 [bacterium ADurb.Bin478]|nr:MAG: hypothetical protein BWY83_01793 [bacterium ADurb.Bin478]
MTLHPLYRPLAGLQRRHFIAVVLQRPLHQRRQIRIIIHDQQRSGLTKGDHRSLEILRRLLWRQRRQKQLHQGAGVDLTVHDQTSLMSGHNAIGRRQTQAVTAAFRLGGDERLAQPSPDAIVDAGPVVQNLDHYGGRRLGRVRQFSRTGADQQAAAGELQRLQRIAADALERLMQQRDVGHHPATERRKIKTHLHRPREQLRLQAAGLTHERVHRHRPAAQRHALAEILQTAKQHERLFNILLQMQKRILLGVRDRARQRDPGAAAESGEQRLFQIAGQRRHQLLQSLQIRAPAPDPGRSQLFDQSLILHSGRLSFVQLIVRRAVACAGDRHGDQLQSEQVVFRQKDADLFGIALVVQQRQRPAQRLLGRFMVLTKSLQCSMPGRLRVAYQQLIKVVAQNGGGGNVQQILHGLVPHHDLVRRIEDQRRPGRRADQRSALLRLTGELLIQIAQLIAQQNGFRLFDGRWLFLFSLCLLLRLNTASGRMFFIKQKLKAHRFILKRFLRMHRKHRQNRGTVFAAQL